MSGNVLGTGVMRSEGRGASRGDCGDGDVELRQGFGFLDKVGLVGPDRRWPGSFERPRRFGVMPGSAKADCRSIM
jgi:hypothetical protein